MAAEKYVGKMVYSCGFNGFGQLPLVSSEMQKKRVVTFPQLCTYIPCHEVLAGSLALGWSSCFICKDKEIEVHGFFSGQTTREHKLPSVSDVKSVHAFQGSVLALPSSCGAMLVPTDSMQLKEVNVEVKGHDDPKIMSLDSTDDTVYVVTDNLHLDRLEQNETNFIYQEIFSAQPVEVISCGKEHVMVLTKAGSVFSFGSEHCDLYIWGWNESGQLGYLMKSTKRDDFRSKNATTRKEHSITPVDDIISHPSTKEEKDQDRCRSSKASTEDNSPVTFLMSPQILDMCPPEETLIKKVSCGSRHTAAITQEGHLYTWGFGRWGQLGHGNEWTLDTPTRVESLGLGVKFIDVYCKEWNTFMLVEEPT